MLVPQKPTFDNLQKDHITFHTKDFKERRQKILSELRCISGLPEIARSLSPDTLYKVIIPEGKILQQGKDGLYRGVVYGDQGIDRHAKFAQFRPSLIDAVKTIGSQFVLINIAMQLNRIEKMVENLSIEIHRDRIAEINSGVDQFDKALILHNKDLRNHAIMNSIQTLHTGLQKTIAELKSRIAEAPNPENNIFYHLVPWHDKVETAKHIMGLAQDCFYAALIGIRTLAECYSALGEINAAKNTLLSYFKRVLDCNIESASEKARLVEYSGSIAPQEPWENFIEVFPKINQYLLELDSPNSDSSILEKDTVAEIEFMPFELLQGDSNNELP